MIARWRESGSDTGRYWRERLKKGRGRDKREGLDGGRGGGKERRKEVKKERFGGGARGRESDREGGRVIERMRVTEKE